MVLSGGRAPWEGREGLRQQMVGTRDACALACGFLEAGFDEKILDVISDETAELYREELASYGSRIVQLMPALAEVERRNRARSVLTGEEVLWVYGQQSSLSVFDQRIDNTTLPPEEVAARVLM